MFSSAASAASQFMFGAIRRMSRAYSESEERGEREKERGEPREVRRALREDELGPRDIQFPVKELRRLPLTTKAGWMRSMDVFRYMLEPPEEDGTQEVMLEVWSIGRNVHNKLMEVGQLYQVKINWGLATIKLNLVGVKDEVPLSLMPSVIECGAGPAFVIRNRDFHTYRMYGKGRCVEGPAMGARLLFLAILDLDLHQCTTIGDFEQWPVEFIFRLFDEHVPGESFRRPEAWEAGLTTIRMRGSDSIRMDDDLWLDGNDTATSEDESDLGQSPSLGQGNMVGGEERERHVERNQQENKRPRVEDKEMTGQQLMAATRVMEESRNAPPPTPAIRHRVLKQRYGVDRMPYGAGPGGWNLSEGDWLDIDEMLSRSSSSSSSSGAGSSSSGGINLYTNEVDEDRSSGREVNGNGSEDSSWRSPRAELSFANMNDSSETTKSSLEMLMMSPEDVMRNLVREHEECEEKEIEVGGGNKRKRSASASTTSMSSLEAGSVENLVFSPVLARSGSDIINVSTTASSSDSLRGGSGIRGIDSSPVFTFSVAQVGWRFNMGAGVWGGMPQGSMAGPASLARAVPIPCPEGITPLCFVDDVGVLREAEDVTSNEAGGDEAANEGDEEMSQEEVFNISQVD